jgi:hypothetical protein
MRETNHDDTMRIPASTVRLSRKLDEEAAGREGSRGDDGRAVARSQILQTADVATPRDIRDRGEIKMTETEIIQALSTEMKAAVLKGWNSEHLKAAIGVIQEHMKLKKALSTYGYQSDYVRKFEPDWQTSDRVKEMLLNAKIIQSYMGAYV